MTKTYRYILSNASSLFEQYALSSCGPYLDSVQNIFYLSFPLELLRVFWSYKRFFSSVCPYLDGWEVMLFLFLSMLLSRATCSAAVFGHVYSFPKCKFCSSMRNLDSLHLIKLIDRDLNWSLSKEQLRTSVWSSIKVYLWIGIPNIFVDFDKILLIMLLNVFIPLDLDNRLQQWSNASGEVWKKHN